MNGTPIVNCQLPTVNLITPGLPPPELNIVVILLLALTFGGLIIGLTAGAGAKNDSQNNKKTKILFHGHVLQLLIRLNQ